MTLTQALRIRPGVTAIIGGGGKTTLLRALGEELARGGHKVLLCTTTKIYPFPELENVTGGGVRELAAALRRCPLACTGTPVADTGKLTTPELSMGALAELAEYVLVEADGAAGRPMKAHAAHEPVIPTEANEVICVVGASGFGQQISLAAHRPELYAQRAGANSDALITPELEAAVLLAEGLHHRVYVNQAESPQGLAAAKQLKKLLPCPVAAGALRTEGSQVLCW